MNCDTQKMLQHVTDRGWSETIWRGISSSTQRGDENLVQDFIGEIKGNIIEQA